MQNTNVKEVKCKSPSKKLWLNCMKGDLNFKTSNLLGFALVRETYVIFDHAFLAPSSYAFISFSLQP